jgi:integrase
MSGTGSITRRGRRSWRVRFDIGRTDGKRVTHAHTVRGSRKEAQQKLAELVASVGRGSYVEPSKVSVAAFARARIDQWEAAGDITARTAQRYRQLAENQIVPHIGATPIQKLARLEVEGWHTALRNVGLAARTVGHAHRVLSKVMSDAERDNLVLRNVCKLQKAPRVADTEMPIIRDIPGFIDKLRGTRLFVPALVALFGGLRLGEVLALRWNRVDLDGKVIQVREALEWTKAHGLRFKAPKSRAGRRDVTLPDLLVDVLREHRKAMLELRLQLGAGRLPDDALLFANLEGKPLQPSNISSEWGEIAARIGLPQITFHSLRHSHVSQLVAAGVDIATISKRVGHARASVTLAVYSHMFSSDDSNAAAAINAAMT